MCAIAARSVDNPTGARLNHDPQVHLGRLLQAAAVQTFGFVTRPALLLLPLLLLAGALRLFLGFSQGGLLIAVYSSTSRAVW